jgi:hypothetical protein
VYVGDHFAMTHLAHTIYKVPSFHPAHWTLDALASGCESWEEGAKALLKITFSFEFSFDQLFVQLIVSTEFPRPQGTFVLPCFSHFSLL